MILHDDSHIDHVSPEVLKFVLEKFADRNQFFLETIELPEGLTVSCGLHGPAMGDPPVLEDEVTYRRRGERTWESRIVDRPEVPTRTITVVGGPYEDHPCVLHTVFGGPGAPQEPGDPNLKREHREESVAFWQYHALSSS